MREGEIERRIKNGLVVPKLKISELEGKVDAIAKHLGLEFFREPEIQARKKGE